MVINCLLWHASLQTVQPWNYRSENAALNKRCERPYKWLSKSQPWCPVVAEFTAHIVNLEFCSVSDAKAKSEGSMGGELGSTHKIPNWPQVDLGYFNDHSNTVSRTTIQNKCSATWLYKPHSGLWSNSMADCCAQIVQFLKSSATELTHYLLPLSLTTL